MNKDLSCLRAPDDGGLLVFNESYAISKSGYQYPIINKIPRFVNMENYCDDFGFQWNKFPKSQLDSNSGIDISEQRLRRCLRGNLEKLKGKKVLEVGSGAGRFTEILLKYGAIVHSLDYSNAVEANALNNGVHENLTLVQADIFKIPFPKNSYDYVVCLGVLQHTESPENSIRSIWSMVKPGGYLVADHYLWKWRFVLPPPFGEILPLYRLIILSLPRKVRFKCVKLLVDFWFPWHWRFRDSPIILRILRRLSPVIFHYPYMKLRGVEMHYEWSLLDTHDGTTDVYKRRRTVRQLHNLIEYLGAENVVVEEGGNGVEIFCRKNHGK